MSDPEKPEAFGRFVGRVHTDWGIGKSDEMKLLKNFAYLDPDGERWKAPRGSVIDGASIPRALWSIVGQPFDGNYRQASVVHDVACVKRSARWPDVHRMFYNAMRCEGLGKRRALYMYTAVYHFGPRWRVPGELFQIESVPGMDYGNATILTSREPDYPDALSAPTAAELEHLRVMIEVDGTIATLDDADALSLR